MSTADYIKSIEREVLRPLVSLVYPRSLRNKVAQMRMKAYLFFKPIEYKYTKGDLQFGKRVCVFVSFQPRGILSTTWKYLEHLQKDLGYSVVFVANCALKKKDVERLKGICVEIIERDNIGYDFGGYKDGILHCMEKLGGDFDELETLLIANDSVIGPIHNMKPIHQKMQAEDCDFWGMNDFFEDRDMKRLNTKSIPHLCSYFACFKNNVLKTDVFKKLWREMHYPNGRKLAIRTEKKLGQYLMNNGFAYSVYVKKEEIIEYTHKNRESFDYNLFFDCVQSGEVLNKVNFNYYVFLVHNHTNSTCSMLTMTHFGMPLMKRDLIRKNWVPMSIFKAILNMYEKELTGIVTKEEILDEMGLNPRTQNSMFKWKKYIV